MHWLSPFSSGRTWRPAPLLFIPLLCAVLTACAGRPSLPEKMRYSPTGPAVTLNESPEFFVANLKPGNQDLQSWRDLAPSVDKSLRYVKSKPQGKPAVSRPGLVVTWGDLSRTLTTLQKLLPRLDAEPQLFLAHFTWRQVPEHIDYSGYYEPIIKASRTKKQGYEQPIYAVPPELGGIRAKGRKFHDRRTIEDAQVLANRGLELAWAADPVDTFFLEIQGSGCLLFEDGTRTCVNYAGQNGHKYKSSGRIMREKGLLQRGDIFEQRQWFKDNPERVREILNENPSYVFFKLGGSGPTGAMGHEVDAWRSLATDRDFIPLGSVIAYGVNIPEERQGSAPLRGIGFAQDVGGAIKRNRIDIFCGSGHRANYTASFLDARGPAWLLLAK